LHDEFYRAPAARKRLSGAGLRDPAIRGSPRQYERMF
jgi:hypothetical protein